MNEKHMERFETLQQKLFQFIEWSLKLDGHCKPYEGTFTIEYRFPSYFQREDDPTWNIHLACYLIGPTRGYDWEGSMFGETLRRAERDIYRWIDAGYRFYEEEYRSSKETTITEVSE